MNKKAKRKTKPVHISFRISKGMSNRLNDLWEELLKVTPDISYSSAVREAMRRGLL